VQLASSPSSPDKDTPTGGNAEKSEHHLGYMVINYFKVFIFCTIQLATSGLSVYNYALYIGKQASNPKWKSSFSPTEIAFQDAYIVVLIGPTTVFLMQIFTIAYLVHISKSVGHTMNSVLLASNTVNIFGIHHIRSNDIRQKREDATCCCCFRHYHWPYLVVLLSIIECVYSTWFIFNEARTPSQWQPGLIVKLILSLIILLNYIRAAYLLSKETRWLRPVMADWANAAFLDSLIKTMSWDRQAKIFQELNRELERSKGPASP